MMVQNYIANGTDQQYRGSKLLQNLVLEDNLAWYGLVQALDKVWL